jgi:hypothetical protein
MTGQKGRAMSTNAVHVTREGWKLEVRAFADPTPRLYVWTRETNREGFTGCVVNGVPYYTVAHLTLDKGQWRLADHARLHMSRAQWRGKSDDWTWPARRKLEARLIQFAEEYTKANPRLFIYAAKAYRDEQAEQRRERIAQLRTEIETLTAELATLEAAPAA